MSVHLCTIRILWRDFFAAEWAIPSEPKSEISRVIKQSYAQEIAIVCFSNPTFRPTMVLGPKYLNI